MSELLREAFAEPLAAAVLPVVLVLAWWLARRERRAALRLAAVAGERAAHLAGELDGRRRAMRRRLFAGGLLLAALAVEPVS